MALCVKVGPEVDRKRTSDQDIKNYCASAGVKFIKVRYTGDAECDFSGFQPTYFDIKQTRGRPARVVVQAMTDATGKPSRMGSLDFTKDNLGVLWAECPDYEQNIRVLAACWLRGEAAFSEAEEVPRVTFWRIDDKDDQEKVRKYAEENAERLGWDKKRVAEQKAGPYRELPKDIKRPQASELTATQPKPVEPVPATPEPPKQAEVTITHPVEKRGPGRPKTKHMKPVAHLIGGAGGNDNAGNTDQG